MILINILKVNTVMWCRGNMGDGWGGIKDCLGDAERKSLKWEGSPSLAHQGGAR